MRPSATWAFCHLESRRSSGELVSFTRSKPSSIIESAASGTGDIGRRKMAAPPQGEWMVRLPLSWRQCREARAPRSLVLFGPFVVTAWSVFRVYALVLVTVRERVIHEVL